MNDKNFLFLVFAALILRCVKRNTYLCKIVRIPRRDYSKRQIILSITIKANDKLLLSRRTLTYGRKRKDRRRIAD